MKLRDANLQVYEKSSLTYPPSCILPLFFYERITIPSSEMAFKVCEQNIFLEI